MSSSLSSASLSISGANGASQEENVKCYCTSSVFRGPEKLSVFGTGRNRNLIGSKENSDRVLSRFEKISALSALVRSPERSACSHSRSLIRVPPTMKLRLLADKRPCRPCRPLDQSPSSVSRYRSSFGDGRSKSSIRRWQNGVLGNTVKCSRCAAEAYAAISCDVEVSAELRRRKENALVLSQQGRQ